MKFENRAIMLRLLSQIYVHHDFVYPMRLLPQFSRVNYCGHNEEIYSPSVATGLVFNAHSRVVFRGELAAYSIDRNSGIRFSL